MKKVALLLPPIRGGAANMTKALAIGLSSRGMVKPIILTPEPDLVRSDSLSEHGIPVLKAPIFQSFYDRSFTNQAQFEQFYKAVSSLATMLIDLDVAVAVNCTNTFAEGIEAAFQADIPSVVWSQGFVSEAALGHRYMASQHLLEQELLASADKNIFISHWAQGVAEARFGQIPNPVVIHNWLQEPKLPHTATPLPSQNCIGFFGTFEPHKGFGDLLSAFNLLRTTNPDLHLAVFSEFEFSEEAKNQIQSLGLANYVTHLGRTESSVTEMKNLTAVVVPSLLEGFGLVAAEAGKAGAPVIAADVGGLREVVVDGSTGLLFPAGDFNLLAAAIRRILDDPIFAHTLGENAQLHSIKYFSEARQIEKFENELLETAQNSSNAGTHSNSRLFSFLREMGKTGSTPGEYWASGLQEPLVEDQVNIEFNPLRNQRFIAIPDAKFLEFNLARSHTFDLKTLSTYISNTSQEEQELGIELVLDGQIRLNLALSIPTGDSVVDFDGYGMHIPVEQQLLIRLFSIKTGGLKLRTASHPGNQFIPMSVIVSIPQSQRSSVRIWVPNPPRYRVAKAFLRKLANTLRWAERKIHKQ